MKLVILDASRESDVVRWSRGTVAGDLIKQNKGRTIWRVAAGSPGLFVKRFAPTPLRDRATKEARMLAALHRAGVRCPRPLATARDDSGTYLVTEELAGSRDLYSLIAEGVPDLRGLLAKLAGVVRDLHEAGFEHQDLHAGNILVRDDDLFVLDVHRARRRTLSLGARLDGIAFMAMSFADSVSLMEIHRFFRAYPLRDRKELVAAWDRLRRIRREFCRRRAARCMHDGSEFGVRGNVFFRKGMNPEGLLDVPRETVKKTGRESLDRLPGGRFLKRTAASRARRIWKNAHGLALRGIPTPKLFACGPGWVVGEWVEGPNLGDVVRRDVPEMRRAEREEFLFRLARFVRCLHARGVCHRDLKSSNILSSERGFFLVDLDRIVFSGEVGDRDRIFNLAQLNASVDAALTRGDRLRFLRYYVGRDRGRWLQLREWIQEIMRVTVARRHLWPPR